MPQAADAEPTNGDEDQKMPVGFDGKAIASTAGPGNCQ
jgi:hypothetical protein